MRELFQSTSERLFKDLVTPELRVQVENGEWPSSLWSSIEESGLTLALVDEDLGGAGGAWSDAFPIVVAAGKFATPAPLIETLLANWILSSAGLEPLSGAATISTNEFKLENNAISGVVKSAPWSGAVDHVVALANSDGGRQVFVLPTTSAEKQPDESNIAREPSVALKFDDATPVAATQLPEDFDEATLLLAGALMRSAQIAGALEAIVEMSIHYANERNQFGRPIAKFQAIQQMIAKMATEAALAYTTADQAFCLADFSINGLSIPSAKITTSDAAGIAARLAHAVHGAIGFTDEHQLHHFTRRLWSWRCEFGSSAFWAKKIGHAAAIRGADAMWPAITSGQWQEVRK